MTVGIFLWELHSWTPKYVETFVMIICHTLLAKPTKFIMALFACHMVTTIVFLDWWITFFAFLYFQFFHSFLIQGIHWFATRFLRMSLSVAFCTNLLSTIALKISQFIFRLSHELFTFRFRAPNYIWIQSQFFYASEF